MLNNTCPQVLNRGAVGLQKFLGSRWPEELGEGWRDLNLEFQERTHEVALKILRALAIALGRDEHYFDDVSPHSIPQPTTYCRVYEQRGQLSTPAACCLELSLCCANAETCLPCSPSTSPPRRTRGEPLDSTPLCRSPVLDQIKGKQIIA